MERGRTLVIGDIHGAAKTFRRLLERIELTPADTLYILGDMIDRLDDSRGVIDTILTLQSEGLDVRPIRGNHEECAVLAARSGVFEDYLDWVDLGGLSTMRSYGVDKPDNLPETHLRFLESLPLYRVTDQFVFCHAGIDCTLNDPFSRQGVEHMLWDRSGVVDISKLGHRRVVSGHTTRKLKDIRKGLAKDHLRIDNGVYLSGVHDKGCLVCVDLGTMDLFVQQNVDELP